jgi:hypothetical protein
MNTTATKIQMPWLSLGLLTALLALTPYAMSFAPHGSYYVGESVHAPDSPASLYPLRVALVIFGLVTTVIAFAEFVRVLSRGRCDFISLAPSFAAFFACAVVGWRSYPYWVMGVYQVGIGAFPPRDQDPKSLIPMTWIGEFWRLPVMFLPLLCFVVLPGLAALVIFSLWRGQFTGAAITACCATVALLFMLAFSPDYMAWLMD